METLWSAALKELVEKNMGAYTQQRAFEFVKKEWADYAGKKLL